MKRLLERLQDLFAACAFAEAGEFQNAREIYEQHRAKKRKRERKGERAREKPRGWTA